MPTGFEGGISVIFSVYSTPTFLLLWFKKAHGYKTSQIQTEGNHAAAAPPVRATDLSA